MMKYILIFLTNLLSFYVSGQVGLSSTINDNAVLDLSSSNKLVKLPKITILERPTTAIDGMLVYNLDNKCIEFYNSADSNWKCLYTDPKERIIGKFTFDESATSFKIYPATAANADGYTVIPFNTPASFNKSITTITNGEITIPEDGFYYLAAKYASYLDFTDRDLFSIGVLVNGIIKDEMQNSHSGGGKISRQVVGIRALKKGDKISIGAKISNGNNWGEFALQQEKSISNFIIVKMD